MLFQFFGALFTVPIVVGLGPGLFLRRQPLCEDAVGLPGAVGGSLKGSQATTLPVNFFGQVSPSPAVMALVILGLVRIHRVIRPVGNFSIFLVPLLIIKCIAFGHR